MCLDISISCSQNINLALRTACFVRWSLVYRQQELFQVVHRLTKPSSLCLLLWAEAKVEAPPPPRPKQTSVMQTSSHLGTGRRWSGSVLEPIRPNCDLQIQNTNRMDWTQTRPTCSTYAPLRPHDQIVSPPLSIQVKNEWSHTSAPTTCLHGLDRENFTLGRPVVKVG